MQRVLYQLPEYVLPVINTLYERNWLVHNFKLDRDGDLYDPTAYLYNTEFNELSYELVVDLNIYQFLLNIVKKLKPDNNFRDAASLLVFCQISNIEIDPTFSVYEKFNYEAKNLDEALSDLDLFHNINNAETEQLAKFALGFSDSISVPMVHKIDYRETKENLMKYKRLKEWNSLYLMILAIVDIFNDSAIPRRKKHVAFCDWMIYKFRRSLVAFVYSLVFFGNHPIKKMMKYKSSQTPSEKRKAVSNMTWDLYIMAHFFRKWVEKKTKSEFIFASDDAAFCALLRASIQIQLKESLEPVKPFMNQSEFESSQILLAETMSMPGRVYDTDQWGYDYREQLIGEYEKKLFT